MHDSADFTTVGIQLHDFRLFRRIYNAIHEKFNMDRARVSNNIKKPLAPRSLCYRTVTEPTMPLPYDEPSPGNPWNLQ